MGMGMNVPSAPPNAAPTDLNIACPAGSPDIRETRPTISGPRIGILPAKPLTAGVAALRAGATTFAALPNIFAANPPTLETPFAATPLVA